KSKTPDSPEINTKWKSENPDMFFTVSKNGSLGKAVINGEKINISVNFEFYCNQLHIGSPGHCPYFYTLKKAGDSGTVKSQAYRWQNSFSKIW
ncbi:MAG: hypothetical protein II699_05615, partial [Lachnospiraceae bacterium]|nr:hypothetical protein [Lachnospiraceae bacterium]